MRLADVVDVSAQVGATRSRTAKIGLLASLLRRLTPEELAIAVPYLSGDLRQGRIGVGGAALRSAIGSPAEEAGLSLVEVDATFAAMSSMSGSGSASRRMQALGALLARATEPEQDFLARLLVGELRQGALAGLLLEGVAAAFEVPADEVRRAVMLAGDLAEVARALREEGRAGLAGYKLTLLRPLQPMLAQPAEDLPEALERLGEASLEWKLDGARVQVHKDEDQVAVFSRRLNEVTPAVPELVQVARLLPARRLVLDGELIALQADGRPHPFQVTMRRFGRKLEVERARASLPLTPFFFDVLHGDGIDLLDRPARERAEILAQLAPGTLVPRIVTADPAQASAFLGEALARGHEGVMAKALDAAYEAGRRGSAWLKVKRPQTLDLVVLAAEWGHGRRAGWLSNLHLGARDPGGGFVMLGKTFKGMTDAMLAWQTRRFQDLAVATDGRVVHLRPEIVVEIAFSDVQESPQYPAGMALRFARVKRYREDKTAAEADTVETVRALLPHPPA
ncbi:MAG TPA: ATP-dependent DNA ligase [Candidatus Polarisedimenticolaceae bacterium]|nr:ATP-dependent DNA ligase [Candidatus Polarisedimenticolaceae bacterium]